MKAIKFELKLALAAWAGAMFGLLIGFHVNQTLGITIGFVCISVAIYSVIKGQIKFFKKLKSHRD
jgi:uncharacterized membrane protein YfcA